MAPCIDDVSHYERDGVVLLRGCFASWVQRLSDAIDEVLERPGPLGRDAFNPAASGRFFQERGLWNQRTSFCDFVYQSPAAGLAGQLMQSAHSLLYSDHLFVKEPHTPIPTPWHQDISYFNILGWKQCSVWVAIDPVTSESGGLEFVMGSHRWPDVFAASDFSNSGGAFANTNLKVIPDMETQRKAGKVVGFAMEPGDCLVFHHRTLHGAGANLTAARRRALSTRWAGDDVVFQPTDNTRGFGQNLIAGASIESPQHPRLWQSDHRCACDGDTRQSSGQIN